MEAVENLYLQAGNSGVGSSRESLPTGRQLRGRKQQRISTYCTGRQLRGGSSRDSLPTGRQLRGRKRQGIYIYRQAIQG